MPSPDNQTGTQRDHGNTGKCSTTRTSQALALLNHT